MNTAREVVPCVHRYVLPSPEPGYGGTLMGVCRYCGTAHEFHDPEYREKTAPGRSCWRHTSPGKKSEWHDVERAQMGMR